MPWQVARHRLDHRRRARRGRQDRAADPARGPLRAITRCRSRRRRSQLADHAVHAARAHALRASSSTIARLRRAARGSRSDAGYDGVEIMGSEGYLINQFLAPRTNQRTDDWGGTFENRMRFPVEIVRRTREAVGRDFIIIYRLSMLDLVEGGSTLGRGRRARARRSRRPARRSSTPASAGTRRACRRSSPWCRARRSPG